MEYKLLCGSIASELNEIVNEHLVDGWTLFGFPFANEHNRFQAVIKN